MQGSERDGSDLVDLLCQRRLVSDEVLLVRKELDHSGRQQLLQSPASLEPSARSQACLPSRLDTVIEAAQVRRDIGQVDVALLRPAVPSIHRVDGLGEFPVVGLVDTTCIHPKVVDLVLTGPLSTEAHLVVASLVLSIPLLHVGQGQLVVFMAPGVREDRIRWYLVVGEVGGQAESMLAVPLEESHDLSVAGNW